MNTNRAKLKIPNPALKASQIMTIGENATVSLDIPRGWTTNSTTRIAQVTPTMVGLEMSGLTTLRPCTAPRTDCAGVKTPSAITMDTAKTPIVLSKRRKNLVCSSVDRTVFCDLLSSFVWWRSMPTKNVKQMITSNIGCTYVSWSLREGRDWQC